MSNGKTEENSHIERKMSTGKTEENSQIEKMGETESKKVKGTESRKVKGSVVLMKKNYVLCCKNIIASFIDRIYELLGKRVSMQLISSVHPDPENVLQGKLGEVAHLEKWRITPLAAVETVFTISYVWDESMGVPEAFIVRNHHHSQFYLKTVTLEDVPWHGRVHFVCNSWVYPAHHYRYNRVFFSNKTYLPCQTPELLHKYREKELEKLRGDESGELKEWDRVYDYAYYNDLGSPDKGKDHARPVLGGTKEYPYPRRGRTGRKPTKEDPCSESRLPLLSLDIYVPRDEQFGLLKFSDFLAYALNFQDVLKLYEGGIKLPNEETTSKIREHIPCELLRELIRNDGERFLKFPVPDVIKGDKSAWRTDEEFGREMLAGVNPVVIRRLQEFPPTSNLDPGEYGNQNSTITEEHIEKNLNGLPVDEAIRNNRLFILDHHDILMPYLKRINSTTTKTYATRTLLLLQDNGTLKPLAIELSSPHPQGERHGAVSKVFTPAEEGVDGLVWQLAKAYAAINDSGYHQLISHWLNTHAVIEPFVIATNRQLSVLHLVHKLLHPHFRDTMHINALARQILINAGGVLERTVFPAKYAMELSSFVYKNWVFTEQALPKDLLKRGIAVEDSSCRHGLRLLIQDYPYAVDGLEIWSAIEEWVNEYCSFYYPTDDVVQNDPELQSWWMEIRNKGHGDKKDEPWWPEMKTRTELIQACTIIIWVASALHAAVNFGQYPYAGYLPNRQTQCQTLLGVSLIEILSRHSTDEIYPGQRDPEWTSDAEQEAAFKRFGNKLEEIGNRINEMNSDHRWRNRVGPVKVPYTLLYPITSDYSREVELTGKGIPNSVSI
uniref:Lipoxygenase n=1 Tax=Quercus lobata TaxID=97700 RepID=A0A7N2LWR0_QUELO